MARPVGIIKFNGTLHGISIYNSKHGWIARKKGGPDPEKMKKHAQFERARENGKEFGACGRAAGYMRKVLARMLGESSDFRVVSRLTKVLFVIKDLDDTSARGARHVSNGLQSQEGRDLLKGFEFNSEAHVSYLLSSKYSVDTTTGAINIHGLIPKKHLMAPKGATQARFKSAWLKINFATGEREVQESEYVSMPLNNAKKDIVLKPLKAPVGSGVDLFLLQVCFLQEVNGSVVHLKNAEGNGMVVADVI